MSVVSQMFRESTFTPENVARLESKLFFDGVKRRRQLEQFSVLLFLAAIIATMGILGDSTATVIGAMIISPHTPCAATAVTLRGRGRVVRRRDSAKQGDAARAYLSSSKLSKPIAATYE